MDTVQRNLQSKYKIVKITYLKNIIIYNNNLYNINIKKVKYVKITYIHCPLPELRTNSAVHRREHLYHCFNEFKQLKHKTHISDHS